MNDSYSRLIFSGNNEKVVNGKHMCVQNQPFKHKTIYANYGFANEVILEKLP